MLGNYFRPDTLPGTFYGFSKVMGNYPYITNKEDGVSGVKWLVPGCTVSGRGSSGIKVCFFLNLSVLCLHLHLPHSRAKAVLALRWPAVRIFQETVIPRKWDFQCWACESWQTQASWSLCRCTLAAAGSQHRGDTAPLEASCSCQIICSGEAFFFFFF